MSQVASSLRRFLEENAVEYERLHHDRDYTAMETAAHTHTPGKQFAKAVIVRLHGKLAMAVLPSHHVLDPQRMSAALGGASVRLASEEEFEGLCPDCEEGAIPPFGNLYGLDVYVSPALVVNERITCVAGHHAEAIRLRYSDFERLVRPLTIELSAVYHGHPRESGESLRRSA
jgi:Ala-tRNA(Pro) deacylase